MADANPPPIEFVGITSTVDRIFPTLRPKQIERAAAQGKLRRVQDGEILVEPGTKNTRMFIIKSGRLEIVRPPGTDEQLVVSLGAGQFTGETSMLAGRPAFVRIRVSESGEVIELERERLMALVQTDSELSEILLRAFLLRRVELIAQGVGDVVLVGSRHSAGTLRIQEFLTRNGFAILREAHAANTRRCIQAKQAFEL